MEYDNRRVIDDFAFGKFDRRRRQTIVELILPRSRKYRKNEERRKEQ